jgi:WD40 repeat protein
MINSKKNIDADEYSMHADAQGFVNRSRTSRTKNLNEPRIGELLLDRAKVRRLIIDDCKLTTIAKVQNSMETEGLYVSRSVLERLLKPDQHPYAKIKAGNAHNVLTFANKTLARNLTMEALTWLPAVPAQANDTDSGRDRLFAQPLRHANEMPCPDDDRLRGQENLPDTQQLALPPRKAVASADDWILHGVWDDAQEMAQAVPAQASTTSLDDGKQSGTHVQIVPALLAWARSTQSGNLRARKNALPAAESMAYIYHAALPLAVLLGEYGTGKTWTCKLLTQALRAERALDASLPQVFYFDLRYLSKKMATAAFAAEHTLHQNPPRTPLENILRALIIASTPAGRGILPEQAVIRAVQQEDALVIFDGLDEVMVHQEEQWGVEFVRTLLSILPGSLTQATGQQGEYLHQHQLSGSQLVAASKGDSKQQHGKVLISCRSHYFKSLQDMQRQLIPARRQVISPAGGRLLTIQDEAPMAAWTMLPLSEKQILQYLREHVPGREPEHLLELLKSIHNLSEICERFIGIAHVVQQIDGLEQARQRGETVNAASIYRGMLAQWIERDKGKHKILAEDKPRLMQALAWTLWLQGQTTMPWPELQRWFRLWLQQDELYKGQTISSEVLETLLEDLRTATFIVRPDADVFAFAHSSILEYCVAAHLYRALCEQNLGQVWQVWDLPEISPETLDFIVQIHALSDARQGHLALRGLQALLAPDSMTAQQRQNLTMGTMARSQAVDFYLALSRGTAAMQHGIELNDVIDALNIEAMSLPNQRFAHIRLRALRASKANLSSSVWLDVQIQQADFSSARLSDSVWENCRCADSNWSDADLRNSHWRQVDVGKALGWGTTQASGMLCAAVAGVDAQSRQAITVAVPDLTQGQWRLRINHGHFSRLSCCAIAYSRHGVCRIISASHEGELLVWNEHGVCLANIRIPYQSITWCDAAFNDEGHLRIVYVGDNEFAQNLYGKELNLVCLPEDLDETGFYAAPPGRLFAGHTQAICDCGIAYGSDGRGWIVSASKDRTVKVWNDAGECLLDLQEHTDSVRSCAIACSDDGLVRIVSGSLDKTARLWNEQGQCLAIFAEHEDGVTSCDLAFDIDGNLSIVSSGMSSNIHIWNESGACQSVIPKSGSSGGTVAVSVSYGSDDMARVAITNHDNNARIWNAGRNQGIGLGGHSQRTASNSSAQAPDQQYRALTISDDRSAKLWDEDGVCLATLQSQMGTPIACALGFTHDGDLLMATTSGMRQAKLWRRAVADAVCAPKAMTTFIGHSDIIDAIAVCCCTDGRNLILTASRDHTARLWSEHGECLATFSGHLDWVRGCALACDSQGVVHIVTSGDEGDVKIWDMHGVCLKTLEDHNEKAIACALTLSPEGGAPYLERGRR